jgi:omega-6 fatty acid desaturase (delta-12 desaturase)
LFLLVGAFHAVFYWGGLASSNVLTKLLMGSLLGLSTAILFVIGHDACHDSLTPSRTLNQILARLAFLPSLHPYSTWELGHNQLHHGWTNLKGVDYVYPPFSKTEFDRLPAARQRLERIYRTASGAGLFYLIEIWWRHLIIPGPHEWGKLKRGVFYFDATIVVLFLVFEFWLLLVLGGEQTPFQIVTAIFFLLFVPFMVWNWLMAFVTLQHHTHPDVAWFNSRDEWNFFKGQVWGTVHATLPRPIELLFHNILEHTAHHVDPKIPLYNLTQSQRDLEQIFSHDIVIQKSSVPKFRDTMRLCKLYDYEKKCWLNFDGTPTTSPIRFRNDARRD